ncbi:MAG: DUF115 domain-containing protein [Spirochaetales bacterium]|nr:DUF115 domain-containing protein [Spirochaetales bacterium]
MSFYEQNLSVLCQRFPGIGEKLENAPSPVPEEFETTESRDGSLTLRYKESWLHSRHAPLREAERLIAGSIPDDCPYCLFYGFGLAYHLDEFVRRHPGTPFAVVEPDVTLFRYILNLRDFTPLFINPDFSFALGAPAEAMPALIENAPGGDIQICMLRPAVNLNREYYEKAGQVIREFLARKEINAHTLNRFSRLWVSNICRNLPLSISCPGIRGLKDCFRGKPALLLAAGPTLTQILPALPDIRKRVVLVCVDTALKACLRAGVEPDFLILTDPQYWNSRHLDRCSIPGSILISDVSTYPPGLRIPAAKTLFCSTPFPLGQYYESRTGIKGKLKSGGSVATAAWDFIRHCGIDEIYCSGLDLSFPEGETHYRGSTFEERLHSFSTRTAGIETSSWLALQGGNPYTGEDQKGEPVLSDQRMKIYIHWFEEQMRLFPDVKTSRLSDRGIRIAGMDVTDSRDLLNLPECRTAIDSIIGQILLVESETDPEELKAAQRDLLLELDDLISLSGKGEEISTKLLQAQENPETPDRLQNMLNELNAIDAAILNRESREMAGFILAPVLEEHIQSKASDPSAVLENSRSLYASLKASLGFHKSQIERVRL